eukprot:TRINITY_DN958_c2_g1_i1.p2 TRINITY_DN958_c2_g1~~TRINITY_DN958_c2_g1_i1.p2  ORF type:complete len:269 (+),score=148.23 TRINITY_DN958_c2_g1_i1:91-807(+)
MRAAVAFIAGVAAVSAQQTPPVFPEAFSATTVFEEVEHFPHFGRHFVDYAGQNLRQDLWDDHTRGRAIFIEDHKIKRRYVIAGEGDVMECWYHPFTGTLQRPDFKDFTYYGEASVHGVPAAHWGVADRERRFEADYFDRVDTHDPVAFAMRNGTDHDHERFFKMEFFEVDVGTQEAKIFDPSYVAPSVPCQERPAAEMSKYFSFPRGNNLIDFMGARSYIRNTKKALALVKANQASKQ